MFKKILVPLDGSDRAEAILPHVEAMALAHESKVIFFQVVEPPLPVATPGQPEMANYPAVLEQIREKAARYLETKRGEFEKLGIDTSVVVRNGPVVEAVVEQAARQDVDLVALASHGRSGLAQVFYGSVAAGLLQRIDRPLLMVRSQKNDE